jgi:hypothetical protein
MAHRGVSRYHPSATGIAAGGTVRCGGGIAPVLWVDVVIVPERSEWDTVRAGQGV